MTDAREPTDALGDLLAVLDRVPFVARLKKDIGQLRRVVYERRAPRIMAVGSVGSGRSSLLNVLLGKPALPVGTVARRAALLDSWVRVDAAGAHVDWLELTPGRDREALRQLLDEAVPDALLVLLTPEEVEDGAGATLGAVHDLLATLDQGEAKPKVIAVLSKVDLMPPTMDGAPFSVGKRASIDLVRQRLEQQLREADLAVAATHVVAVPGQHGLEDVAEALASALPDQGRVEAARALVHARHARRSVASVVVRSCSALAITVAIMPVPLSDMAVIVPLQVVMVSTLAYLSGRSWDKKTAAEWIASLGVVGGVGLGFRWSAQQLVKLIPGAGSLVSAGIAGAGTAALGHSAIAYFLEDAEESEEAPARSEG